MTELSDETIRFLDTSPFFAMLEGKDEAGENAFYTRYESLAEPLRQFLLSPSVADDISDVITGTGVPVSFHTAISKIVALAAIGDVPVTSIENLLTKLNLPSEQSADVARKLQIILEPVIAERSHLSVPAMPELPPLTQKMPPVVPAPSSKPPGRNVIDLRH